MAGDGDLGKALDPVVGDVDLVLEVLEDDDAGPQDDTELGRRAKVDGGQLGSGNQGFGHGVSFR
ncbi:hypothetical protein D3C86_1877070 [compost metagenome]